MRILLGHNTYQQPSGEDLVVDREGALLREAGHTVLEYRRSNTELAELRFVERLSMPGRVVWAPETVRDLRALIERERPDVAHFHNTFAMISPSAYYACRVQGVPIVQSLHNTRLMCPAVSFYRKGRKCEDCLGRWIAWPGVWHGCYRGSRLETAVVAGMVGAHRVLRTWQRCVDVYIVFTEYYRRKFIEAGLPAEKIVVKPHFVSPDPGCRTGADQAYMLFAGRLDAQKGVRTLLRAWRGLPDVPLKVCGHGELAGEMRETIGRERLRRVEMLGHVSHERLMSLVKGARAVIVPSAGSEAFGLIGIEAFACGVPVIASRAEALLEIVRHGDNGLQFATDDADDLARNVAWATSHPDEIRQLGARARREFEARYSAERNYDILKAIYDRVVTSSGPRRAAVAAQ